MARSYARILTNIWDNDDFVDGTTPDAKVLYFHLCSRRDLSSAGHLVVREQLWAQKVFNGDLGRLTKALDDLKTLRYVIIDATSGELLIRTFIRHDGAYRNSKMVSAIRSAMTEMDSDDLRSIADAELTACLNGTEPDPPSEQKKDQQDRASDTTSHHQSDTRSEPVSDEEPDPTYPYILHPASCIQQSSSVDEAIGNLTLVPPHAPDDDGRIFLESVVQFIASQRMQGRRPNDPKSYRESVVTDLRTNHRDALTAMLERCPWLDKPEAAAAHYQARPELHPQEIA